MYQALTFYHSIVRWLVLVSLIYSLIISYRGYKSDRLYSKKVNAVRHWTATIAHIQLVIGILLYTRSPVIRYFWKNIPEASGNTDNLFFSIIHILCMLTAVTIITIGSSLAKRRPTAKAKFKTMFIWYLIALIIILVAIPWPFSHLASRPYFR